MIIKPIYRVTGNNMCSMTKQESDQSLNQFIGSYEIRYLDKAGQVIGVNIKPIYRVIIDNIA